MGRCKSQHLELGAMNELTRMQVSTGHVGVFHCVCALHIRMGSFWDDKVGVAACGAGVHQYGDVAVDGYTVECVCYCVRES
jgi:hypothetical protein